jgi:hypothetical protein
LSLEQELGEFHTTTERSQVGAVIYQLDSVGFHDLPVNLAAGQLVEMNGKLVAQILVLEKALRTEHPARAAGPAEEVHELEHDLSSAVYPWPEGAAPADSHHD